MSTAPNGWQNPKTNWASADVPLPTDFNRIEGDLQAVELGSRTVDQSLAPSGNVGSLRQILSWFANRIKAILGTTNWYDAPPTTLSAAKSHIDNKSNPHSVTAAQVGAAPASHVGAGGSAHPIATTSANGFMSTAMVTKLNSIATGATVGARIVKGSVSITSGSYATVTHNLGTTNIFVVHDAYDLSIPNANQIRLYAPSDSGITASYTIIG